MLGQGLGCQVWLLGQVAFGFRRYHDPFDGQSHTVDLRRPGEPGKEGLQRRGVGQSLLLDRREPVFLTLT